MNFNLIHFKHEDIETDVYQSSEDNSIWLRKEQMSLLFNKSTGTITQQIRKNSLSSTHSLAKMARQEDKNDELLYKLYRNSNGAGRPKKLYDFTTVIGVGYQVKSSITLIFKEWVDSLNNNQYIDEESNIIRFNDGDLSIDVRIMPKEETVY